MEKEKLKDLHERFTNESNSVIKLDELLNFIKNMPLEAQNETLMELSILCEQNDKINQNELKKLLKEQEKPIKVPTKRKVVEAKKITNEHKKHINETIYLHELEISKLIKMSLGEFKSYMDQNQFGDEYNYYMLGLIKELNTYYLMANEAFLNKDSELLNEIQVLIHELTEKFTYLKNKNVVLSNTCETKTKSRIIFLESPTSKIYFLEDIGEKKEYYDSFAKVITAFEEKKPYNSFTITNNNALRGLTGVKDTHGMTRTFFDKYGEDIYIIIGGLIQKDDRVSDYKNQLVPRYKYYQSQKAQIINMLNDETFITQQEQYLEDVKQILGLECKSFSKSKIKGGK